MTASFLAFCEYIVDNHETADIDPEAFIEFYVAYVEPFAEQHGIELPSKFLEFVEMTYASIDDDISEDSGAQDECGSETSE